MIVVDGRTDEEKLLELLAAGAEETAMDYKSTLDLSGRAGRDSVEFAKDAITMGNLPAGGYIVVGVDGSGAPAHDQPPVDVSQFDSADLRNKVAKYVEAPIHIVSQHHVVDGRAVVLIYVSPNADGLPVPTSSIGQYSRDDGRSVTVFGQGEVLLREGSSNVRLRYAHWNQLLQRYRERVRAEARSEADELIRRVVESLRGTPGGSPSVPLDAGMDDETLVEALVASLESGSSIRVQQFLNDAAVRAGAGDGDTRADRLRALDQIAVIACQAVLYGHEEVFEAAVTALARAYRARLPTAGSVVHLGSDRDRAEHYLDVSVRVMAIGALVVRRGRWEMLARLAVQPIDEFGYVWGSWLRHALTMASRAGLLQGDQGQYSGGAVISMARALVADRPAVRPDYGRGTQLPQVEDLSRDDWLLNSLCEFDLWWCILAVAGRGDGVREQAAFYPSCAAFHQWRSQATLTRIANDPAVRERAFGTTPTGVIADALLTVVNQAVSESHQYGGWWDGLRVDPAVVVFVETHAHGEDPGRTG